MNADVMVATWRGVPACVEPSQHDGAVPPAQSKLLVGSAFIRVHPCLVFRALEVTCAVVLLVVPNRRRRTIDIYLSAWGGGGPWGFPAKSDLRRNDGYIHEIYRAFNALRKGTETTYAEEIRRRRQSLRQGTGRARQRSSDATGLGNGHGFSPRRRSQSFRVFGCRP